MEGRWEPMGAGLGRKERNRGTMEGEECPEVERGPTTRRRLSKNSTVTAISESKELQVRGHREMLEIE